MWLHVDLSILLWNNLLMCPLTFGLKGIPTNHKWVAIYKHFSRWLKIKQTNKKFPFFLAVWIKKKSINMMKMVFFFLTITGLENSLQIFFFFFFEKLLTKEISNAIKPQWIGLVVFKVSWYPIDLVWNFSLTYWGHFHGIPHYNNFFLFRKLFIITWCV